MRHQRADNFFLAITSFFLIKDCVGVALTDPEYKAKAMSALESQGFVHSSRSGDGAFCIHNMQYDPETDIYSFHKVKVNSRHVVD